MTNTRQPERTRPFHMISFFDGSWTSFVLVRVCVCVCGALKPVQKSLESTGHHPPPHPSHIYRHGTHTVHMISVIFQSDISINELRGFIVSIRRLS